MRKYLFFLLVLFTFINLKAQSVFNKANHSQSEKTNPFITLIFGEYYYHSTCMNYEQIDNYFLYKYDKNGLLKFKITPIYNGKPHVVAQFKTKDNKLLLSGNTSNCDVPVDSSKIRSFIRKVDTNGVTVFYTKIKISPDNFITALQYADSSYYAFSDSVMFHFSKTGQYISRKNLGLQNISSVQILQNNNFIISAKQTTTNSLVEVNINGNIIAQNAIPMLFIKTAFYNGQKLLGLSQSKKLYKISQAGQLIDSSNFNIAYKVSDFLVENDTIYSILNSFPQSAYAVNDTAFNSISQIISGTLKVSQTAICKNSDYIGILSDFSTGVGFDNNHIFTSLNVIKSSSGNNFFNDIEVAEVLMDSSFSNLNGGTFISYLRAKVKVKNKGNSVINEFTLNCLRYSGFACSKFYYQQKFTQSILPGDSAIVTTTFIDKTIYHPFLPNTNTVSVQYCIFSTMPNSENDKNTSNDRLCGNYVMTSVSIKEIATIDNTFKIFPNPFKNHINIESELEIKKIEVINSLGVLFNKENPNSSKFTFSDDHLTPGIYFIKIETEKGTQIKKVLKE